MGLCSGISHFRSPRRPAADLASPLQLAPARNGPGTVGVPVVLAGVSIASGDIVIGDGDGVVVVPRNDAGAILRRLADVCATEASLEAKVKGGLEVPDFVQAILASDRVVPLD